jgi:hypothetical protein
MQNKPRDVPYTYNTHVKPVLNEARLNLFRTYLTQRQTAYKNKISGNSRPYCSDPVINEYRFTNLFREYDRETRSLYQLVHNNPNLTYEEKILNTIAFRTWNKTATFLGLGGPFTHEQFLRPEWERLQGVAERHPLGMEWFTDAYSVVGMYTSWADIAGRGHSVIKGMLNIEMNEIGTNDLYRPLRIFNMMHYVTRFGFVEQIKNAENPDHVCRILDSIPGIGYFLSYQMFVDFTYLDEFPFSENEYTVAGPGSKRGIDLLVEAYDSDLAFTYEDFLFWLRDHQDEYLWEDEYARNLLFEERPGYDRRLNVMALQNCFCEFQKYVRLTSGIAGRCRRYI